MDLHQLRIFVSIYKNRSFSKASNELNISQPTISEHIKNLETELGTSLFDRLPRTVIPTLTGEDIYPRAVHILESAKALKDAVIEAEGTVKGLIQIGASTIPGTYIIPQLAKETRIKYPEVQFEVIIGDSKDITEKVLNHELNLGIVGAILNKNMIHSTPIASDMMILAAPAELDCPDNITMRELESLPMMLREEGSGTRKTLEDHLAEHGRKLSDLNITATFGSASTIKQAIKSGLGVSIISSLAVKEDIERGLIKKISIDGLEIKRHFYAITHKRRQMTSPYKQFYKELLKLPA